MWRNVISVPRPGLLSVVDPVEVNAIPTIILIVGLVLSPRQEFLVEQRLHLRRWCVGTSWTDLLPLGLDTYIGSTGVGYEVQCRLGPIRRSPRWAPDYYWKEGWMIGFDTIICSCSGQRLTIRLVLVVH